MREPTVHGQRECRIAQWLRFVGHHEIVFGGARSVYNGVEIVELPFAEVVVYLRGKLVREFSKVERVWKVFDGNPVVHVPTACFALLDCIHEDVAII
eukprot:3061520-Pyramimonas_sp.AAC.1